MNRRRQKGVYKIVLRKQGRIVVIDLGSQTTNLIARRIRSLGVLAEVLNSSVTPDEISAQACVGIILSGSPTSVTDLNYPNVAPEIFEMGIPVLGICFGMYLIATHLGGAVGEMSIKEYGASVISTKNSKLFQGLPQSFKCWMNHGSEVQELHSASIIASTENCRYAGIENEAKKLYGLQFHPEVEHTEHGQQILGNFAFDICGASKNWNLDSWLESKLLQIDNVIGNQQAICALSGGVDSTTAAVLCAKVLADRLHCIFIDTGLMRLNEAEEVAKNMHPYGLQLHIIDAKERFLSKLQGVADPDTKRKIIGREYIRVFEEEAAKIEGATHLIQGTIYSDKIESRGTSIHSSKIKNHHNVGGLPDDISLTIYEPLEDLFKDEVRQIGKSLGLSEDVYNRHPFPGPGLAVQIIGPVHEEAIEIVQAADAIVIDELKKAGLYHTVGEIFTNFTGIKTTGVKGDAGVYEWLLAIRSVDPSDLMTSNWSRLPYDLLAKMSNRITCEVKGVNRVVYDITTKPPATIRWE